ncbi:MAG: alpha/beta hydrolase [Clostridia bacterium]|nr:alpha/beta hydrolase [Clostridia bacterium]
MKDVSVFKADHANAGFAGVTGPVQYSQADADCYMYIAAPWNASGEGSGYPLVVFVQGSAWTTPNPLKELPQLCALAREGMVCATVCHRSSIKGNPFPAFLQDVKCAIRFLRANAGTYRIDTERVGVWGTSSGGNAALLAGVTGDDPMYKTDEYAEYSDSVKLVVDCFGPSDIPELISPIEQTVKTEPIFKGLAGDNEPNETMRLMSPALLLRQGAAYPPVFIMQGDSDPVVPLAQSEKMYRALRGAGVHAEMAIVEGAAHEDGCWSRDVLEAIFSFIRKNI